MIEFHIHPLGTGQFRADKFSEQDYYGIEKQLNKNIDYMHILFTPTHVLTIAKKPTKFLLARNGNQQVMNEYTILQREFNSLL
ncbi:MAG: hypothetical protein LBU27_06730 [Candidatus Peribacteria bacterium]|jgi:hypothetical protein|nr:hypothetical protein [Candidatus Peribacteria bacterium]